MFESSVAVGTAKPRQLSTFILVMPPKVPFVTISLITFKADKWSILGSSAVAIVT